MRSSPWSVQLLLCSVFASCVRPLNVSERLVARNYTLSVVLVLAARLHMIFGRKEEEASEKVSFSVSYRNLIIAF